MTRYGHRSARPLLVKSAVFAVVLAGGTALSGCAGPDAGPAPTVESAPGAVTPSSGKVPAPAQRSPSSGGPVAADAYADPTATNVVVNKRRPLNPIDYAPPVLVLPAVPLATDSANAMLRPEAAEALEGMFAAAADDDVGLTLISGYRSYAVQADTYDYWVSINGSAEDADNYSARPGFSEHQTGLALDIGQDDGACTLRSCFGDTAAGIWAAANAPAFGFILRYPAGRQETTGFLEESWHYRFVGAETASSMRDGKVETLEEFAGLPGAPDYG
ncbi:M15 family metallopeptidase [Arthrobacter sp. Hz1]